MPDKNNKYKDYGEFDWEDKELDECESREEKRRKIFEQEDDE